MKLTHWSYPEEPQIKGKYHVACGTSVPLVDIDYDSPTCKDCNSWKKKYEEHTQLIDNDSLWGH